MNELCIFAPALWSCEPFAVRKSNQKSSYLWMLLLMPFLRCNNADNECTTVFIYFFCIISRLPVFPPTPSLVHPRCRQFVEMVNGTDSEVRFFSTRSPKSQDSYPDSPNLSPRHGSNNLHIHVTGRCLLLSLALC